MDYEDLNLRTSTDGSSESAPAPEGKHRPPLAPRIAAVLIVAAVVVTRYYVFRDRGPDPAATEATLPAPAPPPPSTEVGAEGEAVILPPLGESDEAVRELVKALSSNPSVTAWLATRNLIRNFTVVVSNVANGEHAATHLAAIKPGATFAVRERGEDLAIDSRNYARYLPLATAASSIDPAGAARLYKTLKPRIDEAYRELGYPDTPFDQTLERAITLLVKTPIPRGPILVQPDGATAYRFADPQLERLNPSQKLLIRMGPDNQLAVQTALRNIGLALGMEI
jgi:hypothetical protein